MLLSAQLQKHHEWSASAVTLRDCFHMPRKATAEGKLQFEGMPACSLGSSSMIQAVREE